MAGPRVSLDKEVETSAGHHHDPMHARGWRHVLAYVGPGIYAKLVAGISGCLGCFANIIKGRLELPYEANLVACKLDKLVWTKERPRLLLIDQRP